MSDAAAMNLTPEHSAVLVVDVQERLAGAMPEPRMADLRRAARVLLGAARELSVLSLYSEQYPKGLGPTLPDVAAELGAAGSVRFEKLEFSAYNVVGESLANSKCVVLLGMETHVCVYLTSR